MWRMTMNNNKYSEITENGQKVQQMLQNHQMTINTSQYCHERP